MRSCVLACAYACALMRALMRVCVRVRACVRAGGRAGGRGLTGGEPSLTATPCVAAWARAASSRLKAVTCQIRSYDPADMPPNLDRADVPPNLDRADMPHIFRPLAPAWFAARGCPH